MGQRIFGLLIAVLLIVPASAVAAPQAAGHYVIVTLKSKPLASYGGGVAGLKGPSRRGASSIRRARRTGRIGAT